MNNGKDEWPQKFQIECYPPNDSKRRYILKIYLKDKTQTKKELLVIMLNPSYADKKKSDPTCLTLINICESNYYDSITICNLFSLRTSKVEELNEKINEANDNRNINETKKCIEGFNEILCAWGGPYKEIKNKKTLNDRLKEIFKSLKLQKLKGKKILKLKIKKESENKYPQYPPHPLYKKYNTEFEPYCIEEINIEE